MNGNDVRRLETLVRDAIAKTIGHELPPGTSPRTIELMAKAAVAVLEAVDEKPARPA